MCKYWYTHKTYSTNKPAHVKFKFWTSIISGWPVDPFIWTHWGPMLAVRPELIRSMPPLCSDGKQSDWWWNHPLWKIWVRQLGLLFSMKNKSHVPVTINLPKSPWISTNPNIWKNRNIFQSINQQCLFKDHLVDHGGLLLLTPQGSSVPSPVLNCILHFAVQKQLFLVKITLFGKVFYGFNMFQSTI